VRADGPPALSRVAAEGAGRGAGSAVWLVAGLLAAVVVLGAGGRITTPGADPGPPAAAATAAVAGAVVAAGVPGLTGLAISTPSTPVTGAAVHVSGTLPGPDVARVRLLLLRNFWTVATIEASVRDTSFMGMLPLAEPRPEGRLVVLALAEGRSGELLGAARQTVSIEPLGIGRVPFGTAGGQRRIGEDGFMGQRSSRGLPGR